MTGSDLEVRGRVERYSLLRAAQRALARCMHPSVLDPLRSDGRELLIRLQAAGSDDGPAAGGEAVLAEIDQLLSRHLAQTLVLIGKLEFAQLRAVGPDLCKERPEETRALVDVLLLGKLADDRQIRLVEYLVTMLSVEDRDGRRAVVCEPSEVTEALRELSRCKRVDVSIDAVAAVARLGEATQSLTRGDDHAELRDEIRAYKQDLAARILHPKILAAAVAYNVAMANQVSARIDSTMAIDQLADDLLADLKQPEAGDSDLLNGQGMTRLVVALRARVQDSASQDEEAARIVAAFTLDGLVSREIEALEDSEGNPLNPLIASSVVLGCVLRQRVALREDLAELGLDPEALESGALPELLREMGAASSKLFADSEYAEAFELSEAKTRNLATLSEGAQRRARKAAAAAAAVPEVGGQRPFGLSPGLLGLVVGSILGILVAAFFLGPFDNAIGSLSKGELARISPYLDSGDQRLHAGGRRFVGQVFPVWDHLSDGERKAAATQIAQHFEAAGVHSLVLLGTGDRTMVRWEDGELVELERRPTH
jgi:hypothetical protein